MYFTETNYNFFQFLIRLENCYTIFEQVINYIDRGKLFYKSIHNRFIFE